MSDPWVLAFDTSAAHCAAALLCGDRIIATRTEAMGRGQAERLIPLLEETLAEAGIGWADLAAVAVGIGPGNFTGIRISVSAARGLALGLNIPAIGVSGFEAAALDLPTPCVALIAAPRDQVYVQTCPAPTQQAPALVSPDQIAALSPDGAVTWVGPQAQTCAAQMGGTAAPALYPLAEAIARAALRKWATGADLPAPAPLYVKSADAAPSRDTPPVILDAE